MPTYLTALPKDKDEKVRPHVDAPNTATSSTSSFVGNGTKQAVVTPTDN